MKTFDDYVLMNIESNSYICIRTDSNGILQLVPGAHSIYNASRFTNRLNAQQASNLLQITKPQLLNKLILQQRQIITTNIDNGNQPSLNKLATIHAKIYEPLCERIDSNRLARFLIENSLHKYILIFCSIKNQNNDFMTLLSEYIKFQFSKSLFSIEKSAVEYNDDSAEYDAWVFSTPSIYLIKNKILELQKIHSFSFEFVLYNTQTNQILK